MGIRSFGVALLITLATLAFTPEVARAQETAFGYAFVSPAAVSNIGDRAFAWNVGGGGEAWTGNQISVGGELGYLNLPAVERSGPGYGWSMPSSEALLLSVNGSRHFQGSDASSGWRPFVTGGISFLWGCGSIGLFNFGGGVDRWVAPHAGLRFEVRDQLLVTPVSAGSVLLGFRVGVVFR